MELLALLSFFAVVYAYFGYPLCLIALRIARGEQRVARGTANAPQSCSIIITCRNEESVLQQKLENTMAVARYATDNGVHSVQVIVASDCSEDRTDEIATSFASQGVELIRTEQRGGKEQAQEAALGATTGDIILFTDAKVLLEEPAVCLWLSYFNDPLVGAVSSVDRVITENGEGSGEGFYVRYEMWLREIESSVSTLIGLSGSGFAVRKSLCDNWNSSVPSDFHLLLRAQEQGLRGVHAPDIVCSYRAVPTEEEEFRRKVRTVLRGITTLGACSDTLNFQKYGMFAWQMASHKLARWLVPWWCVLGSIALLPLAGANGNWFVVFVLWFGFLGISIGAYWKPELRERVWAKIPLFFCITNAAVFIAGVQYLSGKRSVQWNPSNKMEA